MARVSQLQLSDLYPEPPSWAGEALADVSIEAFETMAGQQQIERVIAMTQGVGGEYGWAELQRRIMGNPAVGLPDVVELAGERLAGEDGILSKLATIQKWNIGTKFKDFEWLAASGISTEVLGAMRGKDEAKDKFDYPIIIPKEGAIKKRLLFYL